MSGANPKHTAVANAALASIRGCTDAQHLLHVLRQGCAPADALNEALSKLSALDDAERMRGFCRVLQKELEARA